MLSSVTRGYRMAATPSFSMMMVAVLLLSNLSDSAAFVVPGRFDYISPNIHHYHLAETKPIPVRQSSAMHFLGPNKMHEEKDVESPSRLDLAEMTQNLAVPVQGKLDELTGGWAMKFADLSPESPETALGRGFLMTNLFYLVAGVVLTFQGDAAFGFFTDLAAVASFNYHYAQLKATSQKDLKNTVRFSLLMDYMAAGISILTALVYLVSTSLVAPEEIGQIEASIAVGMVSVVFLALSWRYEYGKPYMFFHSLWHLCSALSGYLIGSAHIQAMSLH